MAELSLPIAIAALPLLTELLRIILLLTFEPLIATEPMLAALPLPIAIAALPLLTDLLRMILLLKFESYKATEPN